MTTKNPILIKLNDVIKVKFLKPNDFILTSDYSLYEYDIDFDDLLKLINRVESEIGLGKSLHKEAFTGVDYLGNPVKFNSYLIWTVDKIFKYNFGENLVPFNAEILKRNRDKKIDNLFK